MGGGRSLLLSFKRHVNARGEVALQQVEDGLIVFQVVLTNLTDTGIADRDLAKLGKPSRHPMQMR